MKIPAYLMTELVRRLDRGCAETETRDLIEAAGLSLDEPGPEPDFEALTERYEGPARVGSFVVDGTLELFGQRTPIHFRISYAVPLDDARPADMMFGPSISVDLLTWGEFDPDEATWMPVAPNIFSDAMLAQLWPMIPRRMEVVP